MPLILTYIHVGDRCLRNVEAEVGSCWSNELGLFRRSSALYCRIPRTSVRIRRYGALSWYTCRLLRLLVHESGHTIGQDSNLLA